MAQYIIACGGIEDGYNFYGPFDSFFEAEDTAKAWFRIADWTVIELKTTPF